MAGAGSVRVSPVSDLNSDRPLVEHAPVAPGGRSAPPDGGLGTEIAALAALLAEVVQLAEDSAIFLGQWALIAELALEHESVRAALRAEGPDPAMPEADSPNLAAAKRLLDAAKSQGFTFSESPRARMVRFYQGRWCAARDSNPEPAD